MSTRLSTEYPGNAIPPDENLDMEFIDESPLQIPTQHVDDVSIFKVPTVIVDLPSKGLVYPPDHPLRSGTVEMKYMTAREEDILSTESFIKNGTVIDRFLQSLIVTPGVSLNDMLAGDIDAITVAARVYGYGPDYEVTVDTPSGNRQRVFADLSKLMLNTLETSLVKKPGVNEFEYKTPTGVIITFKLLTQKDQQAIQTDLKRISKLTGSEQAAATASTQLKHQIIAVNGDRNRMNIAKFIDEYFLAKDARALRKYIESIQPGIDLSLEVADNVTGDPFQTNITIGIRFFWPDAAVQE